MAVQLAPSPRRIRPRGGRPNRALVRRYQEDLRTFPSWLARAGVALLVLLVVAAPFQLTDDWLLILSICGCFAVGAIGLNLLTGYTGQVSLGHAFFVAVGGYVVAHLSGEQVLQSNLKWVSTQPLIVWIVLSAVIGAAVGALIGPFALRLRGNYLAIVTLALLFFAQYLFTNWESVTGGGQGLTMNPQLSLGPIDFGDLKGLGFDRQQGVFWLIWIVVAITAILARNLVRSRAGRAMQAVRDGDLAAEVVGVSQLRYKLGVFAVSSAMASVGGALYLGVIQGSISADPQNGVVGLNGLIISITYVAIVIIGGLATVYGAIIGALVVQGLPQLIQRYSGNIPFLSTGTGGGGIISVAVFNNLIFGVLIVVFLLFEPLGLAALWQRLKAYFKTWPFSY